MKHAVILFTFLLLSKILISVKTPRSNSTSIFELRHKLFSRMTVLINRTRSNSETLPTTRINLNLDTTRISIDNSIDSRYTSRDANNTRKKLTLLGKFEFIHLVLISIS